MNWTGGRLQRHSKASRNEAVQRQKQHFARIRQQIQIGRAPSMVPFEPVWLAHDDASPTGSGRDDARLSYPSTSRAKAQQTKLEDYAHTAPLAHRLSLMSQHALLQGAKESSRRSSQRNTGSLETTTKVGMELSSPGTGWKKKTIQIASRSSRVLPSRKRQTSPMLVGDTHERDRTRLLQQSDWVGLSLSRPVEMHFASHQDKYQIGKRRKMVKDRRRKHLQSGQAAQTPHGLPAEEHIGEEDFLVHGALLPGPTGISVKIGEDVQPSEMTAAGQQHLADDDIDVCGSRQSSEIMLFEEEPEELRTRNAAACSGEIPFSIGTIHEAGNGTESPLNLIDKNGPEEPASGIYMTSFLEPHFGEEMSYEERGGEVSNHSPEVHVPTRLSSTPQLRKRETQIYQGAHIEYQQGTFTIPDPQSVQQSPSPFPDASPYRHERLPAEADELQPSIRRINGDGQYKIHNSKVESGQPELAPSKEVSFSKSNTDPENDSFRWPKNLPSSRDSLGDKAVGRPRVTAAVVTENRMTYEIAYPTNSRAVIPEDHARNPKQRSHHQEDRASKSLVEDPAHASSDSNTPWKRFVFDDSSESQTSKQERPEAVSTSKPRDQPTSSLFVWGNSSVAGAPDPDALPVAFSRHDSARRSSRTRVRSTTHDLDVFFENPGASSDAPLAFRDEPGPLDWKTSQVDSNYTTTRATSVANMSMMNNDPLSASISGTAGEDPAGALGPREGYAAVPTGRCAKRSSKSRDPRSKAAQRDGNPPAVKFIQPVRFGGGEPEASHAESNASRRHAQIAPGRHGAKQNGPAGGTEKGKALIRSSKWRVRSPGAGSSIVDFPDSDDCEVAEGL